MSSSYGLPTPERSVGFGSWPCEYDAAARSRARLIRAECPLRIKESPNLQFRPFPCARTVVPLVFTQPGSVSDGVSDFSNVRSRAGSRIRHSSFIGFDAVDGAHSEASECHRVVALKCNTL